VNNSLKPVTPTTDDDEMTAALPKFYKSSKPLSTEDFKQNMNIFTEFGDLTPTQTLTLFDQFINWPEYKDCPFTASLDSALLKLHTAPEEDHVDGLEIDEEDDKDQKRKPDLGS